MSIKAVEIDPQVKETIDYLEQSFQSPKEKRLKKKLQAKAAGRRGRRAVYDLHPELIREVKRIAMEEGTTASQVAGLAIHMFLQHVADGNVDLGLYKRRILANPRYEYLMDLYLNQLVDE